MSKVHSEDSSGLALGENRADEHGPLITISSESVQAADRFAWYSDQVRKYIFPVTMSSTYTADFSCEVSALQLGPIQVAHFTFPPLQAARTARHIRHIDPESYHLGWVRRGDMGVTQKRSNGFIDTDDMVLLDTSHPMEADVQDDYARAEVTILRIQRNAFSLPSAQADRLLAHRLAPGGVSGSLLRQHLDALVARASGLGPAEVHRLGNITADLLACFVADRLDRTELVPLEARTTVLRTQINAFINRHLGDPELRPATIAAHHHMSLRSLHSLFRQEPATVAAAIRRLRLERCRADLADPGLRDQPIAVLAARWGLLLPAEFSRAFKAAYGMTPREYRAEANRLRSARDHNPLRTRPQADQSGRRHDEGPAPAAN
ncbi:helix-turn-helix domain-containing protein [Kitasatospora sp. NPDC047058]|uniref:AraC-like ligand-binding domain-containing protein n=1 Tax=Kitasatospora sp. NPDC047058 TaxID=3155620 RepID=UPI0033D8E8B7